MAVRPPYNFVATQGTVAIPKDLVIEILSHTDPTILARVASVCKLLKHYISESNTWKKLHERTWGEGQSRYPIHWQLHCWTVARVQRLVRSQSREVSLFWSFGLVRESIISQPQQPSLKLQQTCLEVVQRTELALSEGDLNPKALSAILYVLQLLESRQIQGAKTHFEYHWKQIQEYSPLLYWWLNEILLQKKVSGLAKVPFPSYHNPNDKRQRNFVQGFLLVWLKFGSDDSRFVTLRALKKIVHELKEEGQSETRQGLFLEELLFRYLSLMKWIPDLENLANLYFHFPQRLTERSLSRDANGMECQLYPHDSQNFRQDELNKAKKIFLRIIQLSSSQSVPLRIGTKLSRTLCEFDEGTRVSNKTVLLPVFIFQTFLRSRPKRVRAVDLDGLVELVTSYNIEEAYSFVNACLKWIKPVYDEKSIQEMHSFLLSKLDFYEKIKNPTEKLLAWVELCHFRFKEKQNLQATYDPLKEISSLLEHPTDCEVMISISSPLAEVRTAIAYAYYKLDRIDESLRVAASCAAKIDSRNLQWLAQLGERDIRAMVIYSLSLHEPERLENYYLETLEYLQETSHILYERSYGKIPPREFFAYHNLAVRLYFEITQAEDSLSGAKNLEEDITYDMNKVLQYAQMALDLHPESAETCLLMSLFHARNGDFNESKAALREANLLADNSWSEEVIHQERDLLLLPRLVQTQA